MLARPLRSLRALTTARTPLLRALCTQKPAEPKPSGKEVSTEPKYRNKDGIATYNYGSGVNLPEVTKEQAENAYLEATDVRRAMTPPIAVAVEARDDMLKDRFNYVAKNLNPKTRAIYAGADGAVEPEVKRAHRRVTLAVASPHARVFARCCAVHLEPVVRHRQRPRADGRDHDGRLHPHAVGRDVREGAGRQAAREGCQAKGVARAGEHGQPRPQNLAGATAAAA